MEALPAVHAGVVSRVSAAARSHPLPSRLRLSFSESFACASRLLLTNSYGRKSIGISNVCSPTHTVQIFLPRASAVADAVEVSESFEPNSRVDAKEHFYRVLPTLDDSLAGKFLENCETLDQVREAYLKKHKEQYELQKLRATQSMVMSELAKVTEVDVPHSLIEEQGRNMYAGKLLELQARMNLGKDQLTGLSSEEMVNNYLISQKQTIVDAVKQVLAVAEIFKLENLRYTEAELKKEVETAEADFKQFNQEYDKDRLVEQAQELLEGAKVLEWLVANSDISYVVNKP
ncbi:hypothetical protein L7F22_053850 [Adiantum nelumboides]|nr:hypothetical protein [Adiantum nelumboides]